MNCNVWKSERARERERLRAMQSHTIPNSIWYCKRRVFLLVFMRGRGININMDSVFSSYVKVLASLLFLFRQTAVKIRNIFCREFSSSYTSLSMLTHIYSKQYTVI